MKLERRGCRDVKDLLGTKPADLGYWSGAESNERKGKNLCDLDYQALMWP